MMKSKARCCNQCVEMIARRSTSAARMWMDLCSYSMEFARLHFKQEEDGYELRLLEQLGMVTSTDVDDRIVLKVNGLNPGNIFCCRREHG